MGTQEAPDRYNLSTDGVCTYILDTKDGTKQIIANMSPLLSVDAAKKFLEHANLGAAVASHVDKPDSK